MNFEMNENLFRIHSDRNLGSTLICPDCVGLIFNPFASNKIVNMLGVIFGFLELIEVVESCSCIRVLISIFRE